jgi:hypothetical protein
MVANFLKIAREVIREQQQKREISELSEISQNARPDYLSSGTTNTVLEYQRDLNALNSLNSQLPGSEKPFRKVFTVLERRCPEYVEQDRWQQAVEDGRRFLATWEDKAIALGWTPKEVFGLHTPPSKPHPSYHRLSRYDETGLAWHLNGSPVVAMSSSTAAIQHKSGSITNYRKENKPGWGPLGDSLDDFT